MISTIKTLANVVLFGGATVWAGTNSLFNVEGGHRAVVFNRLLGIKDEVRWLAGLLADCLHPPHRSLAPHVSSSYVADLAPANDRSGLAAAGVRGGHALDGAVV